MTTDGWCSEVARAFMETNNITTIIVIVVWVIASALILMNLLAAIFVDKLMQVHGLTLLHLLTPDTTSS